ncbi:hypothetical protein C0J52_09160 [Blattella germanica]|nr:hypothetical protein C0J52_09160 [Blattella germanica]
MEKSRDKHLQKSNLRGGKKRTTSCSHAAPHMENGVNKCPRCWVVIERGRVYDLSSNLFIDIKFLTRRGAPSTMTKRPDPSKGQNSLPEKVNQMNPICKIQRSKIYRPGDLTILDKNFHKNKLNLPKDGCVIATTAIVHQHDDGTTPKPSRRTTSTCWK